jgi:acetyltransferase-like isoleucine patch superfamily enzyme
MLGSQVGSKNTFNDWVTVVGDYSNLRIGNGNVFNQNVVLNVNSQVHIGDENHFSAGVKLMSTRLDTTLNAHMSFPIRIGNGNWLAADSLIAVRNQEIEVSNGVTLAAKAFLNTSARESGLYAGVPASIIKKYSH